MAFSSKTYLFPGNTAFKTIPAIAAIASEVKVTEVPKTEKVKPSLKPKPDTKITAAMMRFLDLDKSTLFSTMFLTPIAEIIP